MSDSQFTADDRATATGRAHVADAGLLVVIDRLDAMKEARTEDRQEAREERFAIKDRLDKFEAAISTRLTASETAITSRLAASETAVSEMQTTMARAKGGYLVIFTIGAILAWFADVPGKVIGLFTSGDQSA